MNEIKLAALAAAGLLAAVPSAHATATATATLTNFHYQVFDLDPNDGIAAAVTFASGASVSASASHTDGTTVSDSQNANGAIGSALSVSALLGGSSASSLTTAGDPAGADLWPGAWSSASAAGAHNSANGVAWLVASSFTLTPHTLLVFSGTPSGVKAATTALGEAAYASASVQISDAGNTQYANGRAYANVYADGATASWLPAFISASFSNLTNADVTGFAYAYASTSALGVAAIPEPASYALMVTGLLTVGLAVRRRRTR